MNCYLPTSHLFTSDSQTLKPDSQSKLWAESTAEIEELILYFCLYFHIVFVFVCVSLYLCICVFVYLYFCILICLFTDCELYSRQTPSLFGLSCFSEVKAAKPSKDPFPDIDHKMYFAESQMLSSLPPRPSISIFLTKYVPFKFDAIHIVVLKRFSDQTQSCPR